MPGQPAVHAIGCVGRLIAAQPLDDGRYNILLRGMARIRIQRELPGEQLYRVAEAEILTDNPIDDEQDAARWRQTLIKKAHGWFPNQGEVAEQFGKLLQSDLGLGTPVADVIHDRQAGGSGFASLIFNADPNNQIRVVTSVRHDAFQIPNGPDDQAAGIEPV